jgi:ribulose-5-phosphate 4-epimerase/fuculose-1-phosphate aldolase
MLQDNRLLPATQTAAFFHERIAYDDTYTGLASSLNEGERLASLLKDKSVMFLKNHGVITVGDTVAQAYRLLYKLEKACRTQVLAMSTGMPLNILEERVIDKVRTPSKDDRHSRTERERLYFEAMMRVLDRVNPGYAD